MNVRRRVRIALLAAVAAIAVCSLAAMPALASGSANPVIADCLTHPNGLTGHYSAAQLRQALQVMPAETKEYTSCPDVINRALLAVISTPKGTGGGGGGSGGSFLPTPVIIILVLLALAAVTFGAVAVRRRREADGTGAEGHAVGNPGPEDDVQMGGGDRQG